MPSLKSGWLQDLAPNFIYHADIGLIEYIQ